MKVTVRNMISGRGNFVANQFIIDTPQATYFQSYRTIIAKKDWKSGKTFLDKDRWDFSVTTGKYRNQFLLESIAETRKKIDSGTYKLIDLNN